MELVDLVCVDLFTLYTFIIIYGHQVGMYAIFSELTSCTYPSDAHDRFHAVRGTRALQDDMLGRPLFICTSCNELASFLLTGSRSSGPCSHACTAASAGHGRSHLEQIFSKNSNAIRFAD
eukprot:COSAG02_NODE_4904_length_4848_cov_23.116867_2_plen_120_part_00